MNDKTNELQRQIEFWTRKAENHAKAGQFTLSDACIRIAEIRYEELERIKTKDITTSPHHDIAP